MGVGAVLTFHSRVLQITTQELKGAEANRIQKKGHAPT